MNPNWPAQGAPRSGKIYFVHDGKAAYPELAAYKRYFDGSYTAEELSQDEVRTRSDLSESICWHMMGFYPKALPAKLVIHDYRSLSVGRFRSLKDRMKGMFNASPDLRIFQNEPMRKAMGFSDAVPTLLLPMGVPEFVSASRRESAAGSTGPYCYIGAMSAERKTHLMIDSFIKRFGSEKIFSLYGDPEPYLVDRYKDHQNIEFLGKFPQDILFNKLKAAAACVCYFPNHYPHLLQTPTKLLEYAALGQRIIANKQAISLETAKTYGIACLWGDTEDMFAGAPDSATWEDNIDTDYALFTWPEVIRKSGVDEKIKVLTN